MNNTINFSEISLDQYDLLIDEATNIKRKNIAGQLITTFLIGNKSQAVIQSADGLMIRLFF